MVRALLMTAGGGVEHVERPRPPEPRADEVRLRMTHVALNHLDVFSARGMAFARQPRPLVAGCEGVGVVIAVGLGVDPSLLGVRAAVYPGLTCGECAACRAGRENLCRDPGGIMGFHVDGLAAEEVVVSARQLVRVPEDVLSVHAACAPLTGGTAENMLFATAQLQAGDWVLIHGAGSGIGSAAIGLARAAHAQVIATVGSASKLEPARRLGVDHVVDRSAERFEHIARRLTGRRGVDVVFEHVGKDTWRGSLLSLRRGGHLVTCGATSGTAGETNLLHLFNQQIRITGCFGGSLVDVERYLDRMAAGVVRPVIDSIVALDAYSQALDRLAARDVFGKIVLELPA
ncbi:MAG: zinc-binding dehydrogenase [Methylocystis sp.]|nr:zinc-binding dehydrogenase [Phenylobacterium sp.]MCA3585170.1 zinc-binding dehydrogenase [Methylocystis sp.]MCA6286273.1 zinc-binding dehydrogenase [Phenylobacterium sp.]MCA6288064.1 zinc-binding dehydrogenase [Phenylobacterium sp.]MCA6346655.1 zinc-binding dehydrogenase [Phenylobacterium sp.]MCA6349251.1 zinc-binding dehydrogenase [Phenylobacterium sp.]